MYKKEIAELRKRFRYQKGNINKIYGCYVGQDKKMGEVFSTGLSMLSEEHVNALLGSFKKVLSSQVDRKFRELEFPIKEITDGERHRILMDMRKNGLSDIKQVEDMFAIMAEELKLDSPYLILMTYEAFDVRKKSFDVMDMMEDEETAVSTDMFSFITCAVCPVKESTPALEYQFPDKLVQGGDIHAVKAPELGFVFPAFTDFATDIYHLWFYTKDTSKGYDELAEKLFNITPPAPSMAQKEAFSQILEETLEPSLGTVAELQLKCMETVEDAGLLGCNPVITKKDIIDVVADNEELTDEQKEQFSQRFDKAFGTDAEVNPEVLMPCNGLKLEGEGYSIKLSPEYLQMVQIQNVNGVKVLTIPVQEGAELNGIGVKN